MFFAIQREFLEGYNLLRERWKAKIEENGGRQQKGGRFWFKGEILPSDHAEEFVEDMSTPLHDLSSRRQTTTDSGLAFSIEDVDEVSAKLGIPWERSKDVPFGKVVPFIGFDWDLEAKRVGLQEKKKDKYVRAIVEWRRRKTHTLEDVERLYRKLLHTCLIVPEGRAYLTKLEKMIGIFHDSPFKPRRPSHQTDTDLLWWLRTLSKPTLSREIPGAQEVIDVQAFSDASSSVGVGIVIRDRWRAWTLRPGWKAEGRDIAWAEAVGMELLIRVIVREVPPGTCFKIFGDNRGVVEGWWSGRSRNHQVNEIFKRIHLLLNLHRCAAYTRYVLSASNPADGPSRGVFPGSSKLLPPVELPSELQPFICPHDHNEHGFRRQYDHLGDSQVSHKPRIDRSDAEERRDITADLESQAWQEFEAKNTWQHL